MSGGMSAQSWFSRPREWVAQAFAKWVDPLARINPNYALGVFSQRFLASKDGHLVEIRVKAIPASAGNSQASANASQSFSNRALLHGRMP